MKNTKDKYLHFPKEPTKQDIAEWWGEAIIVEDARGEEKMDIFCGYNSQYSLPIIGVIFQHLEAKRLNPDYIPEPEFKKDLFNKWYEKNIIQKQPYFKKHQNVMVRNEDGEDWQYRQFFNMAKDDIFKYMIIGSFQYKQCRLPTDEEWEVFENGEK